MSIKDKKPSEKDVLGAITKIFFCICFCVTAGVMFSTCGVSKSSIQECRSACGSRGMISASTWSCQCGWSTQSNDYVLPRKKD